MHIARILIDPTLIDLDMFEFEGCDSAVASAGQDREGNECTITTLDIRATRHRA